MSIVLKLCFTKVVDKINESQILTKNVTLVN